MPYVPLHERGLPLDLSSVPRYASPDRMDEPSRKRRREDENGGERDSVPPSHGQQQQQRHRPPPPPPPRPLSPDAPIAPSIFGIAPRNEFTRTVGDFIMANCQGRENVEIEIKLGTLHAPQDGGEPRRIRVASMTEMILPSDFPTGPFGSTLTRKHHTSLNRLLNSAVETSIQSPFPIRFFRAKQVDSFYGNRGGKTRVSRDLNGAIVPDGVIRKRRLGDLNVASPGEAFDWRISVNVEEPAELPDPALEPQNVREKDRACYRHQICQVDLTVVTSREAHGGKGVSFELEIEVLDVPALIAEGEREMAGEPNRFDEMLQSVLDTARMLIRNA